ncbi:putative TLC domain-containing protein [Naja naja]|nr:putative TLC domain-containing protein [Naja naja]
MAPWLRSAGLVAGSTLAFAALRWALSRCPLPAHVRRDATRTWRWRNLLVSFAHSVVAGLWAVVGLWQLPGAFDDLVETTSPSVHLLLPLGLLSGVFLNRFVAAGLLSMFVEVSNIFLTLRMMMRLGKLPLATFYEVNKYLNLAAYFLFRLAPQAYLTWFFVRHVEMRGQGAFLMVNLVLLDAMILMYFSRLLRSDFCPGGHRPGSDDEKKYLID